MKGNANRYLSTLMADKARSISGSSKTYKYLEDKTLKIKVPDLEKVAKRCENDTKILTINIVLAFVFALISLITNLKFGTNINNQLSFLGSLFGIISIALMIITNNRTNKNKALDDAINRIWFMFTYANIEGEIITKFDEIHNEVILSFVDKYEADRNEIKLAYTTIPNATSIQNVDMLIDLTTDKINNSNIIVYRKTA